MKLWAGWLMMLVGTLMTIGKDYQKQDDNTSGTDDLIGGLLIGIGFILQAVVNYFADGSDNKKTDVFRLAS